MKHLRFHSLCVAVAIICATATTASTPRLWRDGGRRHLRPQQRRQRRMTRIGTYKHSKKQNVVPQHCTPEQFVGDYKYRNCQGVETKVRITCDNDNGTNPCDYQEAPLKNDNTDDGCIVQGSFGATHIRKDPANLAVCQLDFVALKDSCKATALPFGFGMRAEVDRTAGPADTSTSTLVLWFSNDGGVVYYNEDEPQEPVFLHQGLPKDRKLLGGCECDPLFQICNTCDPKVPNNCRDDYCAHTEWEDGCEKCLCYKNGNRSWCDGTNSAQIDKEWESKKEDPNYKNRKCNTIYSFNEFGLTSTFPCYHNWQCEKEGYACIRKIEVRPTNICSWNVE